MLNPFCFNVFSMLHSSLFVRNLLPLLPVRCSCRTSRSKIPRTFAGLVNKSIKIMNEIIFSSPRMSTHIQIVAISWALAKCVPALRFAPSQYIFCNSGSRVFSTGRLIGLHFRFDEVVMELLCGIPRSRRLVGKNCDARGMQVRAVDILLRYARTKPNASYNIKAASI